MDVHQSPPYARFMTAIGWQVEKVGSANVFIKHLPLLSHFSVIKVQRFEKLDLVELGKVATKHHAFLAKLEPLKIDALAKTDSWPLLPTKTIILDLTKSLPSNTKNKINRANKLGLVTKQSKDINLFIKLWQKNAEEKKFWVGAVNKDIEAMYQAFKSDAYIFITYDDKKPLSGILITGFEKTANYFYAFSTAEGRKKWAAYHCLTEAIKILKRKGYKYLDFQGIYDERYPTLRKDWQGFTEFKKRWGGKEIYYPSGSTESFNIIMSILLSTWQQI